MGATAGLLCFITNSVFSVNNVAYMDAGIIVAESTCLIVTLSTGMLAYRKMTVASRLLFFQVLLAFIFLILGYILTNYQKHSAVKLNNQFLLNIYVLMESALLFTITFKYAAGWPGFKKMLMFIFLYLLVLIAELYFSSFWKFMNYLLVAESLIISIFFFVILYRIFSTQSEQILKNPTVWISVGMIIYFVCCIPYFSLFDFLNRNYQELSNVLFMCINIVLANVRYLFISYGFWLMYKQRPPKYV